MIPELPSWRQSAFAGLAVLGAAIALLAPPEPSARPAERSAALCENGRPMKRSPYITYGGLPPRSGYERGHIIPLCLGGPDSLANLQYQPIGEAKVKNAREHEACELYCRGEIDMPTALQIVRGE